MEADWEFEIGPQAPIIDAAWPGLVDLRNNPGRIHEIAETALAPGLARALLKLNSAASSMWTAKCDLWVPDAIDPDELDAPAGEATFAQACYIDLLPRQGTGWSDSAFVEAFCRRLTTALKAIPGRNRRVDLIVRRAILSSEQEAEQETLGITAYLTACGAAEDRAAAALAAALSALGDSLCAVGPHEKTTQKLQ